MACKHELITAFVDELMGSWARCICGQKFDVVWVGRDEWRGDDTDVVNGVEILRTTPDRGNEAVSYTPSKGDIYEEKDSGVRYCYSGDKWEKL